MMESKVISEEEAMLLLKLAAEVEGARARLNLALGAIAARHGVEGEVAFNYSNRMIMQIPQQEGMQDGQEVPREDQEGMAELSS